MFIIKLFSLPHSRNSLCLQVDHHNPEENEFTLMNNTWNRKQRGVCMRVCVGGVPVCERKRNRERDRCKSSIS